MKTSKGVKCQVDNHLIANSNRKSEFDPRNTSSLSGKPDAGGEDCSKLEMPHSPDQWSILCTQQDTLCLL